jgi:hypothetical protein
MNYQDKRFYKVKNAQKDFLCALCSTPRQMRYSKNLSSWKYLQVFVLYIVSVYLFFDSISFRSLYLLFFYWITYEAINKILYRKELPCPYCGFDAAWYRRDVKVARKLVEEFQNKKNGNAADQENIENLENVSLEQLDQAELT